LERRVASLSILMGILALILAIIPIGLTQIVGVAAGLVGLILAELARRRAAEAGGSRRPAMAGLVLGFSGAALSAIFFVTFINIMDRVATEAEGASARVKQGLGEELTREFGRARGSSQFHDAMMRVLKRAEKNSAVK